MLVVFSGGLTIFTILMGIAVLGLFQKTAINTIRSKHKISAQQWLILGVYFGFLGQVLDNTYWSMAWTADFLDSQSQIREWFFSHGVVFNIPFRQSTGILAAAFHIKAALSITPSLNRNYKLFIWFSAVFSTLFSLLLLFANYDNI